MQIKVFGTGCARCEEARALVESVVRQRGLSATVEKVSDLKQMMQMGILSTPAVAIDGVVRCTGRVPSAEELMDWLSEV